MAIYEVMLRRFKGTKQWATSGEGMKRLVIKVPAVNADILQIGEDCPSLVHHGTVARVGHRRALRPSGYVIEKISDPFKNQQGWKMVEITLVERTKE